MTFKQKLVLLIAFIVGVILALQLEKYLCQQ